MSLALEGVLVIDLTAYQQGPMATTMLADMGAEVIKVEPRVGEAGRTQGPWKKGGTSAYFEAHNRGKKSICLDIRKEKGKEVLLRLVKKADIFAQNFRPGVADRLGIGYADLSKINPGLVYMTGSAFGLKGPMREEPGFDGIGQAMGGTVGAIARGPDEPYKVIRVALADQTGAFLGALGAMFALYHKQKTGEGQEVDVSLLGSTIALVGWSLQSFLFDGRMDQLSRARITGGKGMTCVYACKDKKAMLVHCSRPDVLERSFKVLGLPNLLVDSRFDTAPKMMENEKELLSILDKAYLEKTREEWLALMKAADVTAAPVFNFQEVSTNPQALINEYITEVNHPKEGPIKVLGLPIKLHKTPGRIGTSPELGQHAGEILKGLGYSAADIAQMKKEEII